MPRTKRPAWLVEETKSMIFQAALELFNGEGYQEVSMRKIAGKAGCSATTIYNYYPNKDALYLNILKRGFEILLELLESHPRENLDPVQTLRRFTQTFFWFSQEYPRYYDLMFSSPVPKYLDYVGTGMEEQARDEKIVALRNLTLLQEVLEEGRRRGSLRHDLDAAGQARFLFGLCHGIISLHRSHIWPELGVDFQGLYSEAVENFLSNIMEGGSDDASKI